MLFDPFDRELATGSSVSAALKAAKVAAIDAGVPRMGWSRLVLLGEGSMTPFPGGFPSASRERWGSLVLALAIAAGVLLLLRQVP